MAGRRNLPAVLRERAEHIGPIMQQVATGEPTITIWRKLDTNDEVGWD